MVSYELCLTCGRLTQSQTNFCSYCDSPLTDFLHSPEPKRVSKGILLGHLQRSGSFHIPINYWGYHFAFYGVTGSGKTRLAMKLAMEAEKSSITLLILDVEGEWKNIIPSLKGKTDYYATYRNLKVNPFELGDIGLTRLLLKETIFKGIEVEYRDLSPQMNYVLDKCILRSKSMPELIDNVTYYQGEDLPFKLVNLDRTKTALLVRLEPYKTNPVLNEIFYCFNSSIDLNKLDDRNLIFDLHELERKVAYRVELRLLYNTIAIAYLRQALARRTTDKITHMFMTDEAQLLAPKILRKIVVTDTWATTEFATRLRKRGESLVIISQSPANIEDDIRKNAQNNFYFRLQSPEDIKLVTGTLGYTWYSKVDYFTQFIANLKQREAIVKTPLVEEPFIITAPEVHLAKITEKDLKQYLLKVEFEIEEEKIPEEKPELQAIEAEIPRETAEPEVPQEIVDLFFGQPEERPELSENLETEELEKALMELDDLESELYPEPQDLVETESNLPTELHGVTAEPTKPIEPIDRFEEEFLGVPESHMWTDDEFYRHKRARELGIRIEPEEDDEYY